jgi:hypothetical protein
LLTSVREIGLPTYLTELFASHCLLFAESEEIVKRINGGSAIDLELLKDYQSYRPQTPFQMTDFPIFGNRIQHIHQRMVDWRPLRLRDLYYRPYKDPVTYYAFAFAVFIGLIGIVGLVANVGQFIVSMLTFKKS